MRPFATNMVCGEMPIITALDYWAATTPERVAITYLSFAGRERQAEELTFAQLAAEVNAMAVLIEEATVAGDRVALLMDQGMDYVTAFLACLRVGRLAVPLFGVDARRSGGRVRAALADCEPAATVLDRGADQDTVRQAMGLDTRYLSPADATPGRSPAGTPVEGRQTAYLQYTSGSTREPAGVMVTQDNLAVASSQLRHSLEIEPSSTVVTWLPYFHDMGLLLGLGASLQAGAHCVHMSPMAFVQQPVRWLRAVSDFHATTTVVPNFALDHATTRIPEEARIGLDLSALRSLGNGSEPIRGSSLRAFTDMFAPFGFTHEAHLPGYGLAETTLVVTSALPGEGPTILSVDRTGLLDGQVRPVPDGGEGATLVSVGRPIAQEVKIVDPETCDAVPDGDVGEVWVKGPNVCAGYYRNAALTAAVFDAESPDLPGRWARTGDLAAFVDGQLYIVGRIKDLIIVGGKNHYPADVEGTVQDRLPMARPNGVAVFAHAHASHGEVAVAVVELDPKQSAGADKAALVKLTRSAVSAAHDLALHEVVLTAPGTIPKTTSGKIQRRVCATKYAQGQFASAHVGTAR